MKALFYRKCSSNNEYKKLRNKYTNFGQWLEYSIAKKIVLNNEQYKKFVSDFSAEQLLIIDNLSLMHMDKDDKVFCLLVTNGSSGYLIYSAGYSYARYVAMYEKEPRV